MYVLHACSVHECMQCVYMSCAFMQHICRAFMQYVYMSCILHDSTYACMLHTAGMHVLPCLSMIARACMHLAWIARMHKAWVLLPPGPALAALHPRLRLPPSSCSMCTCRNGRFHGPLLQRIQPSLASNSCPDLCPRLTARCGWTQNATWGLGRIWFEYSAPLTPPCRVSSRVGYGPCAASTCPFTTLCCCQFRREVRRRFGNASTMCGHMCLVARPEPGTVGACSSPPARMQQ